MPTVITPPLAMILTMDTPRSARSRTAASNAARPDTAPPMFAQCPAELVIGGPEATTCGQPGPGSPRSTTAQSMSPRSRTAVTPARSCAVRASVMIFSSSSGLSSRELVQRPRAAVAAQVRVRVDQSREQCGAGSMGDRAAGRHRRRGRLHPDDDLARDQHQRAVRQLTLTVERHVRAVAAQPPGHGAQHPTIRPCGGRLG